MERDLIGIFDSGVGGLAVLKDFTRLLPKVKFCYLGDNGNAPYGNRTDGEIFSLVYKALKIFEKRSVSAVVLACNTATAVCAESMRKRFSFPIVGMEPAVKRAAENFREALVLCTRATARSPRFSSLLSRFPNCKFDVFPSETLAGEIESALKEERGIDLKLLPKKRFQNPSSCVVLGCTHYLFLRREIRNFYSVPVLDGNLGTAKRLASLLNLDVLNIENGIRDHENPANFDENPPAAPPEFWGKWAKENEKVYFSNKCFQNFY